VELPKIPGPYRLLRLLSTGGMGVVFEGEHTQLKRRVAVKLIKEEFAQRQPRAVERFKQEALATAALLNPHIVQVTDFHPNMPVYLVMELLSGGSLRAFLTQERKPALSVIHAITRQILHGLSAAHDAGIVHRDLKPENIFLVSTPAAPIFVKILDFGLAKLLDAQGAPLTRTGELLGSLAYMPPEQLSGAPISERSDIYSVGVLLYEMIVGKRPYSTKDTNKAVNAILKGAITIPSDVSPALAAIVLKAMSPLPSERFASAKAMIAELDNAVQEAFATTIVTDLSTPLLLTSREALPILQTQRLPVGAKPQPSLSNVDSRRHLSVLRIILGLVVLCILGGVAAYLTFTLRT
jgi:serine/threonine protein kinase